jgi:hypothetical protein
MIGCHLVDGAGHWCSRNSQAKSAGVADVPAERARRRLIIDAVHPGSYNSLERF